jgi:uncharacterized membrane protein
LDTYRWLLALHVTGAFLVLGGAAFAGVFSVAAQRSERPSEIALFMRMIRIAVVAIGIGSLLTLVLGLWLVHHRDYSYGEAWVILALVLWAVSGALGGAGGRRERETRELAERLAGEDDVATPELRARLGDPVSQALSWGSGLAMVAVLALMIWKPGA